MAELKLYGLGHGADYNPDQWFDRPDILQEDIRLMKLAGCNLMSVGIFAWTALEPRPGEYEFDRLEAILDALHENGIRVFLATPSGARPAWMSMMFPEVLRVRADGGRNLHGGRHNHCFTSPVYREFVGKMNRALAERFGKHPAVAGWHISNEYGGECHCELCQAAFRDYLKARYGTLDRLNHAWWTGFWSKTYTDWEQLHSPSEVGETALHGLTLAWQRFVTHQTADFIRAEAAPIRELTPELPITANLMELYSQLDYVALSREIDFASYDSYPRWGGGDDEFIAHETSFNYDRMRCLKHKPFVLMESTPSQVNWQPVCKLKKPGMHLLSSLQAVAHGSDTVMYFQWRKGRGGVEKMHGAVVDHAGHEFTRTFRDVAEVGRTLKKLAPVLGKTPAPRVALIYDVENHWAVWECQGPRQHTDYMDTVLHYYAALRRCGVDVDVIDETYPLDGYALVVAPMLYMLRPGAAERLTAFVENGGTLVASCLTGRVDEDDLCFLGGFPGPLRLALGIWIEECDGLYDFERNGIVFPDGARYDCGKICDIVHTETAWALASYEKDFYKGMPCVTKNRFGRGTAYYIATCPDDAFLNTFMKDVVRKAGIKPVIEDLPRGVTCTTRGDILFVMNFTDAPAELTLPEGTDLLTGKRIGVREVLEAMGVRVIQR